MGRAAAGSFVALFVACATAPKPVDLPQATVVEPELPDGGAEATMPKAADSDLAASFDGEKAGPPKEEPKPVAAPEPSVRVEEEASARATLDEQLKLAQKALTIEDTDAARPALDSAQQAAAKLFPADQQKVAEQWVKLEKTDNNLANAWKAALAWLMSCGPDKIDGCRAKVFFAMGNLAAKKDAPPSWKDKLKELRDADTCVRNIESSHHAQGCTEQAAQAFHRTKDKLMLGRMTLARAYAALQEPKRKEEALGLFARVEGECDEVRCAAIRRRALKERWRLALKADDLDEAARDVLLDNKLATSLMPASQRVYARTPDAEKICGLYDAKSGPGSCRKLEKRINGEYTFKDYSAGRPAGALGSEKVKEVNEHYGCLLEECLTAQADRMRPPDSETYEVRWMVLNDGKVSEVHLQRKQDDESALGECLRKQFAVWRYPRYAGEFQHIEQRFIVTARERRPVR